VGETIDSSEIFAFTKILKMAAVRFAGDVSAHSTFEIEAKYFSETCIDIDN
jgi:hypothetical protein